MRILMAHVHSGGISHYRSWAPARALERAGHEVTYFDSDKGFNFFGCVVPSPRLLEEWLLAHATKYDLMCMEYSNLRSHLEMMVATRNYAKIPFVTDIDDNPLNVPVYNESFKVYHPGAWGRKIVRMQLHVSDAVTTSKQQLASAIQDECKHTYLLPNYHDPLIWRDLKADPKRENDKSIRVMFSGGRGRYGDLETVKEAFTAAMERYDGTHGRPMLRLFFLGFMPEWAAKWMPSKTDPAANRAFLIANCNYKTYCRCLRWINPDILFSPVEENEFNKSKSCIKAYEAAECGAAFLCTDFDTYDEVPSSAAIKVRGTYEWTEALAQLIEDPSLRQRLNARLLEWTLTERVIDQHINKWVHAYEEVCSRGPITRYEDIVRRVPYGDSSGGELELGNAQPADGASS